MSGLTHNTPVAGLSGVAIFEIATRGWLTSEAPQLGEVEGNATLDLGELVFAFVAKEDGKDVAGQVWLDGGKLVAEWTFYEKA